LKYGPHGALGKELWNCGKQMKSDASEFQMLGKLPFSGALCFDEEDDDAAAAGTAAPPPSCFRFLLSSPGR
jgi:hypothetical protein